MSIKEHKSFNRPLVSTPLWRYTDLSKFVDLLTSQRLWLTNAEVLASDDPHEGLPGAIQFPHRMWTCIEEVPEELRVQILRDHDPKTDGSSQAAFRGWFMVEEQRCIMSQFSRRQYYLNCWHAADHESVAMWKIYGSPGAGVAIVTNGARLETALARNSEDMYLGAVQYWEPGTFEIGTPNGFDTIMVKRVNFSYEREVRLVHWDTKDMHNALSNSSWNEEKMRYEDIVEDNRDLNPGLSFPIDIDILIEQVVISPTAPSWYLPMFERLKERLNFKFPVITSKLFDPPSTIP